MADEIEIEKGLPVPKARGRIRRYPFGDMQPGESFMVAEDQRNVASAASDYGKRHGRVFVTRKVPGGTRCWRIS